MKKSMLFSLLVFVLFSSIAALANTYCSGTLDSVYVSSQGNMYVRGDWRNEYTRLCNVDETINNVRTNTCILWSATAFKAREAKHNVVIQYDDSVDCSTMSSYSQAPAPKYFLVRD